MRGCECFACDESIALKVRVASSLRHRNSLLYVTLTAQGYPGSRLSSGSRSGLEARDGLQKGTESRLAPSRLTHGTGDRCHGEDTGLQGGQAAGSGHAHGERGDVPGLAAASAPHLHGVPGVQGGARATQHAPHLHTSAGASPPGQLRPVSLPHHQPRPVHLPGRVQGQEARTQGGHWLAAVRSLNELNERNLLWRRQALPPLTRIHCPPPHRLFLRRISHSTDFFEGGAERMLVKATEAMEIALRDPRVEPTCPTSMFISMMVETNGTLKETGARVTQVLGDFIAANSTRLLQVERRYALCSVIILRERVPGSCKLLHRLIVELAWACRVMSPPH